MAEHSTCDPRTAQDLQAAVSAYLDAFNRMDLDAVMMHFAPDAKYQPGDGSVHLGATAIRRALLPQFSSCWGKMRFEETDRFMDASVRKVVFVWTCYIDVRRARFFSWPIWIKQKLLRLKFGRRACYNGLDILHFDAQARIIEKLSQADFDGVPLLRRAC